jgi:hypothetical protein
MKEKIAPRDFIRSYDFKPMLGRPDCYVEGQVLEVTRETGFTAYKIRVSKDVWSGQDGNGRVGEIVFVPAEVAFMDYPGRIINLSRI